MKTKEGCDTNVELRFILLKLVKVASIIGGGQTNEQKS